jgi:3-oxoacyl-[acyl-carrier protein] reductase
MSRITQMTSPVAVVSGAGSGIGAACADRLAAAGFAVILVGRRPQALEGTAAAIRTATASARVTCLPADVSEPDDVRALADRIGADFEFVDVIVNNAGAPAVSHSDDLADLAAAWLQTYRANTLTAVLLTTALEPLLRSPGGRVILIGSKSARAGNASPAYGTAKAALSGYLAATAARLGPQGITVNLVSPGYVENTELMQGRMPPDRQARILSRVTLGRPGQPEEIAAAVAFLARPDAGFITGQELTVDGGDAP